MNSIKDKLPKMSDAIQAMIDGLSAPPKNFKVRMKSFGHSIKNICYGCAATSTLQKAFKPFTPDTIVLDIKRARFIDIDPTELEEFETAIDSLRFQSIDELVDFYGVIALPTYLFIFHGIYDVMDDKNYKELLPKYQEYCDELKAAGY